MLIIGSLAFNHHFNPGSSTNYDVDVIANEEELEFLISSLDPENVVYNTKWIASLKNIRNRHYPFDKNNVEVMISNVSESLRMYLKYEMADTGLHIASPEVLFSLKKSHIHFPIKFDKHIKDYCFLYDHFSGVDKLSYITQINFKETEERVGQLKTPSLMKSTNKFFGQSKNYVKSWFIHDDIHRVMSHYDKPLYENMQTDSSSAWCKKDMWELFTFEDKCKCVLEEVYVIALERKIIPMLFGGGKIYTSKEAFNWAFMRVCTTLCSGWFREFATNNYFRILEFFNKEYVEKFLLSYQDGNIKMIVEENSVG